MSFFDKLKSTVNQAAEKASDAIKKTKEGIDQYKEESAELKAAAEGAIVRYDVVYKGGLAKYPQEKTGAIGLNIMQDSFILKKTIGSKDWFEDFEIPYSCIQSFEITKRHAGNWEMMLSSDAASARATEVDNVLAITYIDETETEVLLRLEMLTGTTVYNQAKTCEAMLDILRQNKILDRLNKKNQAASQPQVVVQQQAVDPLEQLEKLSKMKDMGIISEAEFNEKKAALLSKI